MRVVVLSERLRPPWDEGFKNTAIHLIRCLRREHTVAALTVFGEDVADEGVRNLPSNRLLLSRDLRRAVGAADPEIIIYVPTASATPAAMLRTRVLGAYAPKAKVAMLALQPRTYNPLSGLIIRVVRPRLIVAQSAAMAEQLARLGCRVARLTSGVDTDCFAPVSGDERTALRARLGWPDSAFIVLHVGHINTGRNVQILARLQAGGCQAVLVGSTSTEQDEALAQHLEEAGVIVIRRYVQDIEHYYQAADCYLFPVTSGTGAIAVPLSVLEAMACDLPVVATPYGDLPVLFASLPGLRFAQSDDDLVAGVLAMRQSRVSGARHRVLRYGWPSVTSELLSTITRELS